MDITDPTLFTDETNNADEIVLWEFTSTDDADLGHTFSEPTIALMENDKWAAIFGNGYEDSGAGEAQLFIVYLEGGLDGVWTPGTDYIKISTGTGDASNRNGLATPGVVDLDGNGKADRVYAGDLQGNLWAFDLSSTTDTNWSSAYSSSGTAKPLFTAAANQPITSTPVLVKNTAVADTVANQPNILVLFGTGQYLVDADNTSTDLQTFYGVWDAGTGELAKTDLVAQSLATITDSNSRVMTDNPVDYTTDNGWYFDLPDSGERVITKSLVRRGTVLFNTMIPETTSDPCDTDGAGWLMAVDIETGGRPDEAPFDNNGDGEFTAADLVDGMVASGQKFLAGMPAGSAILGNLQYTAGTGTTGPNGSSSDSVTDDDGNGINVRELQPFEQGFTGRLSWEELKN